MPQPPMHQASSSQQLRPQQSMNQAPPERPNELQAALLTLTNTQTQFMTETHSSIRNLEMQVGQLENMLQSRPQGNLPSNTEVNPKEQCNAISLRSGKKLEEPVKKSIPAPKVEVENEGKVEEEVIEDLEKNQSPRKMDDYETVVLTEECSAILQRKLPQKLRDPGSFTIPCTIGKFESMNALCDLGASINLMPLSVFRRLKLGEARPTTVTLQLADRSIAHPRGIIEDVLVKVDKVDVVNDCQDSIGKKKKKAKE
ncbi:uncharacterized protein LOC133832939 [Humulus lupulus]|uniref:uncharacterized protein LOC133832939 n=1 Tax=Humulus lupulus TaxID=3486 RepID=UPI002B41040F|nr:uncharacterized protein LOC133832939 [Humulus lupulus]